MASLSCAQNKATTEIKEEEKLIEFTTDRFTLPNLHVTPDGENIIFDVLGDIYQVPVEGGKAEVLLQDNNWKRGAKLSPDGNTLAYISDETGEFQIWTYDLETSYKQVYPIIEHVKYPLYGYWSYKGELLIPSRQGLWSFNVTTGEKELIRKAKEEEKSIMHAINRKMFVNKSGTHAYFQTDSVQWAFDINKNKELFIGKIPNKSLMNTHKVNYDGDKLICYTTNANNKNEQDLIYWNFDTNKFQTLTTTTVIGRATSLNYSFDFINNQTIVLDKKGEIVRMNIETGEYEQIPIEVDIKKIIKKPLRRDAQYIKDSIITASVLRNPVTKPGLDTIYFAAFGKLHSYAKNSEVITELYPEINRFEVSPNLSPNGKYLAYTTWQDREMGHLYVREMITGVEYQITKNPGRYINPAWSPDGTEIVFVADESETKIGIPRQRNDGELYHLDLHKVNVKNQKDIVIKKITPISVKPKRFYPVPVFHPNGKSIFVNTRNHEKDLPALMQINVSTNEVIGENIIPINTHEVLISPDAKHISFIFDEQIWIDTFPYSTRLDFYIDSKFIPEKLYYRGGYVDNISLPKAKSIYEIAPSYLSWQDEYTLMWGSAEEVYTYDVRTEKTEKIADIKVQKSRAIPKTKYALSNARIITMNKEEEIIEKGTILVKDNRIEAVGDIADIMIPKEYKVLDLEGKTIIPGLIDVHAHSHRGPFEFVYQKDFQYITSLAYGITSLYDPNVNTLEYRERAQMIETGNILGPRVFASGNIIYPGPSRKAYEYKNINNVSDVERLFKSFKRMKVHGPIKEYTVTNARKRILLRQQSFMLGIGLTSHHDHFTHAMSRIINGYTAIEHEVDIYSLQKDIIQLIGKSGVSYTPTFIVRPGIYDIYIEQSKQEKEKLLNFIGKTLYKNKLSQMFNGEIPYYQFYRDEIKSKYPLSLKNLKAFVEAGTAVSVGGHSDPVPGIGTHWEIWFIAKGIGNYEALKAATKNGAVKLDLQMEIGSLEKGKLADAVVLNSNPLEDIFNTTDILYTILNGCIYEAQSMKQVPL